MDPRNSTLLWAVAFALPTLSLLARILRRLRRLAAKEHVPALSADRPQRVIRIVAGSVLVYALWQILRVTEADESTSREATIFALLMLAAIVGGEWLAEPPRLDTAARRARVWASAILFAAIGLGAFGAVLYLRGIDYAGMRPLRLGWPVEGSWRVVAGGRNAWLNPHRGNAAIQNEAVDLVSADPSKPTEGQPVFSPVAGRVVAAVSDDPDALSEAEGNFVRIRTEDGTEILLAHLEPNTVRVYPGDRVAAGEELGQAGNTGNTLIPHLHIHAERGGHAVPMLFGPHAAYLVRGDVIRPKHP